MRFGGARRVRIQGHRTENLFARRSGHRHRPTGCDASDRGGFAKVLPKGVFRDVLHDDRHVPVGSRSARPDHRSDPQPLNGLVVLLGQTRPGADTHVLAVLVDQEDRTASRVRLGFDDVHHRFESLFQSGLSLNRSFGFPFIHLARFFRECECDDPVGVGRNAPVQHAPVVLGSPMACEHFALACLERFAEDISIVWVNPLEERTRHQDIDR